MQTSTLDQSSLRKALTTLARCRFSNSSCKAIRLYWQVYQNNFDRGGIYQTDRIGNSCPHIAWIAKVYNRVHFRLVLSGCLDGWMGAKLNTGMNQKKKGFQT